MSSHWLEPVQSSVYLNRFPMVVLYKKWDCPYCIAADRVLDLVTSTGKIVYLPVDVEASASAWVSRWQWLAKKCGHANKVPFIETFTPGLPRNPGDPLGRLTKFPEKAFAGETLMQGAIRFVRDEAGLGHFMEGLVLFGEKMNGQTNGVNGHH